MDGCLSDPVRRSLANRYGEGAIGVPDVRRHHRSGEAGVWQRQETELAIREHVEKKKLRVIPVLLPGADRGKRSELSEFLFSKSFVEFREHVDEDAPFQGLVRGIRGESCEPMRQIRTIRANRRTAVWTCSTWSTQSISSGARS